MLFNLSTLSAALFTLPALALATTPEHHDLEHAHEHEHEEQTIERVQVLASRLGRIDTQSATRTETINGEEIQEKAIMRPGNISMLVAETGGVRVQTTSPSLGSANIRLQGLYGRYTQLLSDGLPLYGGQTASIGLLQIPPTDLATVEIIKGAASSLYGSSALGGVINLISRTPSDQLEGEVLLNLTSKQGQDLTAYIASPLSESISGSMTTGLHNQERKDLDKDGWLDMAGFERGTLRPRLYWQGENDENLYLTLGLMQEQRKGGGIGKSSAQEHAAFQQNQDSSRIDFGLIFDKPIGQNLNLNVKASAMNQNHEHGFGSNIEADEHQSLLLESSLSGYSENAAWLIGTAVQSERYQSDQFREFNYTFDVPAVFTQLEYELLEEVTLSMSARNDWHSEYGRQFSPRLSVLYAPEDWVIRGAYGRGYFAPNLFVGDIDETGVSRLAPINSLEAEQASTSSLDISYVFEELETSVSLFSSIIENAAELTIDENDFTNDSKPVSLVNIEGKSRISGAEMLLRYRWRDIKLTASYLYLDATKPTDFEQSSEALPLTPKHSAGFVAMWEQHGSHVVGFEAYYTGSQVLENNPFLDKSKPYWHLGLLGQITIGQFSYFINFENLLDVRQTKEHPLVLPSQAANGRWTTDIWSRNDGFTVNAGVRFQFGR